VAIPASNEAAIMDTLYTWAALNDPTELALIRRRGEYALPLWETAHQPGVVTNVATTLAASPGRCGMGSRSIRSIACIHTAHIAIPMYA